MASERLPGKALADIGGTPLLAVMVARLQLSQFADVVVATTELPEDDPIADVAGRLGVACVRGSTDDLLSRHLAAANYTQADVLGICGADDPLIDGRTFDLVFEAMQRPVWIGETVSTTHTKYARTRGWPFGLEVYAVDRPSLELAYRVASGFDRAEVVSWWEGNMRAAEVAAPPEIADRVYRLTVDEQPDLELHRRIFAELPWNTTIPGVVALLDAHPEWAHMNAGVVQRFMW